MSAQAGSSMGRRLLAIAVSAPGITAILTVLVAAVAAMDRGAYIIVNTVVTGGMWALMAMGLALIFGVMNVVSFVHGDFFMVGSLTAYFVITPLQNYLYDHPQPLIAALAPLLAFAGAVVAGAVVGILCELFAFRPLRTRTREQWIMNSFVLTVGLSGILVNGHQVIFGVDFRGIVNYWDYPPISIFDVYISFDRLAVLLIAVAVMVGLWLFMKYSKTGMAIRAVSQDETGALMVGVNLNGIQALTLALSGAVAALAGACLLFMFPAYPTVGVGPLYNSWFIVILVGLGEVAGAALGGFVVALLQILTNVYIGEGWEFVVPSLLIIAILVFRPSGIFGGEVRGVLDQ